MDPSYCWYYGTRFIVSDSSRDGPKIRFVREPNSKDDAICDFCEGKFPEDIRGELWVQCIMCQIGITGIFRRYGVYSMFKSTLNANENEKYQKISKANTIFEKQISWITSKKSRILTKEEIERFVEFVQEAPDNRFLLKKVVLIIGVCRALRRDVLVKITIDDIEDNDLIIMIRIPDSKIHTSRCFVILSPVKMKYCALRPAVTTNRKFFV
ncbi:hypothetical protein NQ317_012151, partial [Molorchus minor]